MIISESSWFSLLSIWAMDFSDSNQILGSPFLGLYSPLAIAIVLFLYSSIDMIPTFITLTGISFHSNVLLEALKQVVDGLAG